MAELERHYGEVTDNLVDLNGVPLTRGEVMVKCETLLSDGRILPDPVPPSFPIAGPGGGVFFVPEVGTTVELVVIGGTASVENPEIRYIASLYSEVDEIPSEFQEGYPKRWGVKSPGGQLFYFDFTGGSELVVIDDGKGNYIEMKDDQLTLHGTTTINLGEAPVDIVPYGSQLASVLQQFGSWAGSHIHPHPEGATGPPQPSPPSIPDADAWSSQKVKLE